MPEYSHSDRDIEREFRLYRDLYQLPVQHCVSENTPGPFLEYCQRRRFFVIVFVYAAGYRTYVIPALVAAETVRLDQVFTVTSGSEILTALGSLVASSRAAAGPGGSVPLSGSTVPNTGGMFGEGPGKPCRYRLPAGAIKLFSLRECVLEAVRRIAEKEFKELGCVSIGEITPLVYLQNHFFHGSTYHAHDGIGFMCRVQMPTSKALHSREAERVRITEADIGSIEDRFILGGDRHVFEYAKKKLKYTLTEDHDEEIAASHAVTGLIKFHNIFVKPLFRLFGRGGAKRFVISEVEKTVAGSSSGCRFLDISCGEDKFLFDIQARLPRGSVIVGNDVAWDSINVLMKHKLRNRIPNVYFTNHSSSDAPYQAEAFDISVCKNSLHHMRDYKEAVETIKNLVRVTKHKVIVVDYEDPRKTGWMPLLFNLYYRYVLRDQGAKFLTADEFRRLFEEEHGVKEILRTRRFTVRIGAQKSNFGNAMWAVLEREGAAEGPSKGGVLPDGDRVPPESPQLTR
jgi:ubiquinone/menaquinone biosynthesis C-methylase UbiE